MRHGDKFHWVALFLSYAGPLPVRLLAPSSILPRERAGLAKSADSYAMLARAPMAGLEYPEVPALELQIPFPGNSFSELGKRSDGMYYTRVG
jgi:hypothetical protein